MQLLLDRIIGSEDSTVIWDNNTTEKVIKLLSLSRPKQKTTVKDLLQHTLATSGKKILELPRNAVILQIPFYDKKHQVVVPNLNIDLDKTFSCSGNTTLILHACIYFNGNTFTAVWKCGQMWLFHNAALLQPPEVGI